MITFLIAWRMRRQGAAEALGGEVGLERLGPDRRGVAPPRRRRRAAGACRAAHIVVDQLPPVVERGAQDRVAALVLG